MKEEQFIEEFSRSIDELTKYRDSLLEFLENYKEFIKNGTTSILDVYLDQIELVVDDFSISDLLDLIQNHRSYLKDLSLLKHYQNQIKNCKLGTFDIEELDDRIRHLEAKVEEY